MTHILLIHQSFVPPTQGGGTRHFELAKYLVEFGYKVTIIASDTNYLSGTWKPRRHEVLDGINVIYAPTYKNLHKSIFHRAIACLSFALSSFYYGLKTKNVDLIWGTSPPLFQSLTCLLLSFIKRTPFIFEVRDLWIDFAKQLGVVKSPFLYYPCKLLEILLYKLSTKVMVNSPGFIPFISKLISEDKIALIPNGVSSDDFEIIDPIIVDKLKHTHIKENNFNVMYTGNLGVANDIETILDTAESLKNEKDVQFYFIGGGLKATYFREYVKDNCLYNVSFLPSIPKTDMPALLSLASVCVATLKDIPLFATVYPNKVFDYMAAGKPTILAIDGAIKEVVEKASGGIVVAPGSSSQLKEALLTYRANKSLREMHGNNAKRYVLQYFDRKRLAKELESLVQKVCN